MATALNHKVSKLLSTNFENKITREELNLDVGFGGKKIAYVLHNVLTKEECEALISETENIGYSPALVHHGPNIAVLAKGYRDSQRIMIDDKTFASILFERIGHLLPQSFKTRTTSDEHKLKEINERLRFLRYDPGDKFKPHCDGCYERPDGSARTRVTLQLYLNEGMDGGETTFLKMTTAKEEDAMLPENRVSVIPKTGSILVFEHNILHEGSIVRAGRKYTVRMDVLYANSNFEINETRKCVIA